MYWQLSQIERAEHTHFLRRHIPVGYSGVTSQVSSTPLLFFYSLSLFSLSKKSPFHFSQQCVGGSACNMEWASSLRSTGGLSQKACNYKRRKCRLLNDTANSYHVKHYVPLGLSLSLLFLPIANFHLLRLISKKQLPPLISHLFVFPPLSLSYVLPR